MKGARNQETRQNKQGHVNIPKPEIRDNLDSRQEKEGHYMDHNNKQGKKANSRDKNDAGN